MGGSHPSQSALIKHHIDIYTELYTHVGYVLALPTIWTARTPFLNVATEPRNNTFKLTFCYTSSLNLFKVDVTEETQIIVFMQDAKLKVHFE